jgi:hypothetical protein
LTQTGMFTAIARDVSVSVNTGPYTIELQCVSGCGLQPPALPSPPTGIAATVSGTSVAVTWNASPGATGYRLAATGPGISLDVAVGNVTRVEGSNLGPGVYTVSVFAQSPTGEHPVPATTMFSIGAASPGNLPLAPAGINYTLIAGRVSVGWNVAPGATSYHVVASLNGAVVFDQNVGNATRVDATNVPLGSYVVQVYSVNTLGRSLAAATIPFVVQ